LENRNRSLPAAVRSAACAGALERVIPRRPHPRLLVVMMTSRSAADRLSACVLRLFRTGVERGS
jgi:hypothetical protein